MPTVQQAVREHVNKKPFVAFALQKGLLNNAAFAEEITSEIQRIIGKPVKFSAINMALRRYADELEPFNEINFDSACSVTLQSGLCGFSYDKSNEVLTKLQKLYGSVDYSQGDYVSVTQGLHEVNVFVNMAKKDFVTKTFGESKHKYNKLISISINIKEKDLTRVGLFYIATQALAWHNIPITDIISTFTEMTFILEDRYAQESFAVLNGLVS